MKNILLLLIAPSLLWSQKNLVTNGQFDSNTNAWRGAENAVISNYIKKTGGGSGMITQYVGSQWKGIDQISNIPKNTAAVRVGGWLKADAVEKQDDPYSGGLLTVEFMTGSEKNVSYENIALLTGSTDWEHFEKQLAIPYGAVKVRVMLALGKTNGTLFFDDIKAETIGLEEWDRIKSTENEKRMAKTLQPVGRLQNGGFEQGLTGWRGTATVQSDAKMSGENAVKIESATPDWKGIDQIITLPAGTKSIVLSAMLKSENIEQGKEPWNNALFNVEFTRADGSKPAEDANIALVTGTTQWTEYRKTIPLPEGTTTIRIMLAMGFATGTLFADDVLLKTEP